MSEIQLAVAGKNLKESGRALILLHGRGGSSADMLGFAGRLDTSSYSLFAPQAAGNTWYPYSFLKPEAENEPALSAALDYLLELVHELGSNGIPMEKIFFLGFSQGACLTLEFTARYAARFGGIIALTGGLIGDRIYKEKYRGDFSATPVFIGTSDPDAHVPVERVMDTATQLVGMHATVTTRVYKNMGHTINEEEIAFANQLLCNHLGPGAE